MSQDERESESTHKLLEVIGSKEQEIARLKAELRDERSKNTALRTAIENLTKTRESS